MCIFTGLCVLFIGYNLLVLRAYQQDARALTRIAKRNKLDVVAARRALAQRQRWHGAVLCCVVVLWVAVVVLGNP